MLVHLRKETNTLTWMFWPICCLTGLTSGKGFYFWVRLLTKHYKDNLCVGIIPISLTFVCLCWPRNSSLVMISLKINIKHKLGCNLIYQVTLMSMTVRHCWYSECCSTSNSCFIKTLFFLGLLKGLGNNQNRLFSTRQNSFFRDTYHPFYPMFLRGRGSRNSLKHEFILQCYCFMY